MNTAQALASLLAKWRGDGSEAIKGTAWHEANALTQARMPGFQTKLLPESTPDNLVFSITYRQPDGLSYHTVKVRPSLLDGLSVKVTGLPQHEETKRHVASRFKACLERQY